MILKLKKTLLFSSLLTLLPIPVGLLLWNRFPQEFVGSFVWHIILPPVSLLLGQWLCVFFTRQDTSNADKNKKPQMLVLWIIPVLSNLMCGILYALLLGVEFSPFSWMTGAFGILFAVIGNYMPKTRMNSTIGIKVSWTYSSDANWNATHRLAGRVWVIGGLLMLPGIFLPEGSAIVLMLASLIAMCVIPVWYSWRFYLREKAEGKPLKSGYPVVNKKIMGVSMVFLALLLIFVLAVMFTGNLQYRFEEDSFTIEADWYSDLTVKYDSMESVSLMEENIPGYRVGGFSSLRLLMGFFSNAELGTHIRYTYYAPEVCILLNTDRQTYVLSGETPEETKTLYELLTAKMP